MTHKFLEHTADIKFHIENDTIEESFKESIDVIREIICGEDTIKRPNNYGDIKRITKNIKCEGKDLKRLFYEFIEEIIFIFDSSMILPYNVINLTIKNNNKYILNSEIEFYHPEKINTGIKSITYHEMMIEKINGKWIIEAVVDI